MSICAAIRQGGKMFENVKMTAVISACAFIFGAIFGVVGWNTVVGTDYRHQLEIANLKLQMAENRPPEVVKETVEVQGETKLVYVPKEKIVYRDKTTGKLVTGTEKTDLDVKIAKPEFNIRINGKEAAFKKSDDEKYMFEKNKIQMNQTSKITADVNMAGIIDELTELKAKQYSKRFAAGVWYMDGPAVSLGIRRKNIVFSVVKGVGTKRNGDKNDYTGAGIQFLF